MGRTIDLDEALAPFPERQGLFMTRDAISNALTGLAIWCPHGLDTRRLADYQAADEVEKLLKKAQLILDERF